MPTNVMEKSTSSCMKNSSTKAWETKQKKAFQLD